MEHQKNKEYQMGATFLPGFDDYYMPPEPVDVVSPAPQRLAKAYYSGSVYSY